MEDFSSYITPEKRELFDHLLIILAEIDRICKKNDIPYFAFAGTLLGAVRHKGFIPWDDDIDLLMFRKDYDRFVECCERDTGDDFFLQTPLNEEGYYRYPARMRMNSTTYLTPLDIRLIRSGRDIRYNCGLFVSVFPLDDKPDSARINRMQHRMALFRNHMLTSYCYTVDRKPTAALVRLYCNIVGYKNVYRRFVRSFARYSDQPGKFVHYPQIYAINRSTTYYREDLTQTVELPFENTTLPCPAGYGRVLACAYGDDYMTPPPAQKRERHFHGDYIDLHTGYRQTLSMDREALLAKIDRYKKEKS